jgi:phosphoglucomutase
MNWEQKVTKWRTYPALDEEIKQELNKMQNDRKQLEDCFYRTLNSEQGACAVKSDRVRIE